MCFTNQVLLFGTAKSYIFPKFSFFLFFPFDFFFFGGGEKLNYTANHKKGNSCSIGYFSWKKWLINIFFMRNGKSVIKWSQCHKSHEFSLIILDFTVKRKYGVRIFVWTVNSSKNIKKGPFLFDFYHLQYRKSIKIIDHLKDI